ncbi:MAG: MarR family winged helix-turn-helix transcriptional regulator [Woeseiaceae bacterium]
MNVPQFSHSLPMLLYAAIDVVMPRFRQIFKEFGLTEQQWRVLRVLWDIEEVSHSDLASITLIPAPSLVGVVDRLSKMHLVERRQSGLDRRVVLIATTAQGRELREQIMPAVQQSYFELRDSIDDSTWRALIDGLEDLVNDDR